MLLPVVSLTLAAGPAHSAGPAVALDRNPSLLVPDGLLLPAPDEPAPDDVPITSTWRLVYTAGGVRTWETDLPLRPRTLFFHRAPGDMQVLRDGDAMRIKAGAQGITRANTWAYSTDALQVRRPLADGPPRPGEYTVRYSGATKLENALRYQTGEDPVSFVFQSIQLDDATHSGLLLPAPSTIRFAVDVPEGDAVLDLTPMLLPPELSDPALHSDGAYLAVYVDDDRITGWPLHERDQQRQRVDLSAWAGQTVTLTLETQPDPSGAGPTEGDPSLDYVFVADPVVYVPEPNPPRVVLVFIDTLRQDHLSLYGYARDTTPRLDRWAEEAAVFEQARSVAPWTLPSTQTMLTGEYPEHWSTTTTIQERLSAEGWATTFIAGNIYLSSNFGMARGWSEHRCINWPLASVQIERGLDYLDQHQDRPVFMVLHFMDMHLPYTEPPWYRYLFAGEAPEDLDAYQFHLGEVKDAANQMGASGKQYVRDRYDNNLRYVDDQLARFLARLGDDDTVLIVSDHGEEFWDHGAFEHGHSLYDELLRIPMIARGPGFVPGRYTAPTSLLDVTPSLAVAAGLPEVSSTGMPLQTLSGGANEAFQTRPLSFGRPLYGSRRWGSMLGDMKYTTTEGTQAVYNLSSDPGERENLAPDWLTEGRAALGTAMDTEAPIVFRVSAARSASEAQDLQAIVTVPGGIRTVWIGDDYLNRSESSFTLLDDQTVEITFKGKQRGTREVYILPEAPAEEAIRQARLALQVDAQELDAATLPPETVPNFGARNPPLLRVRSGSRRISMGFAVAPVPLAGPSQEGLSPCEQQAAALEELSLFVERCLELVALGYMDEAGCAEKEAELTTRQSTFGSSCP